MRIHIILCAGVIVLASAISSAQPWSNMLAQGRGGSEFYASDSLNAYMVYRPYPVPEVSPSPAPKGYKPFYISTYHRHGSRKLHRADYSAFPRKVLQENQASLNALGRAVLQKVTLIDEDLQGAVGDLTMVGEAQQMGIAERMYRNFGPVFRLGEINCWSTAVQRTMMSMFAFNERLLELDPDMNISRHASKSFTWLNNLCRLPENYNHHGPSEDYIKAHLDCGKVISRLFDTPVQLSDTVKFISCLYLTGAIVPNLDIRGVDFVRDVFTPDELYIMVQAMSYMFYTKASPAEPIGKLMTEAQIPLLQDIVNRADAVIASGGTGADLRFGHDSFLSTLVTLINLNGYAAGAASPETAIDVFQDFAVTPMAGNVQFVFYRNRSGDVLLKILHNEVESAIPDLTANDFPYYPWPQVRGYFMEIIAGGEKFLKNN